ncbi:MAG TPA: dihydroorotate dehydrogenase electron transfer subunit [Thermoleophilaceae bacterium]|nr:dihydroorotate dehydrogenase electron transfer subunit [Thermoleophilaceae bacterium]
MRRTLAPFGRRLSTVTANEQLGAYNLITAEDPDGPADPRPGQFYMLATADGWGAGESERPYLPRAFSFARASGGLSFLLEAIGPGTDRLAGLEPGDGLWLTGPLGIGFAPPEPGTRPLLVGGGIGAAPLLCWQDELGPETKVLLGFRSAEHAEAANLFAGGPGIATDDGSVGREALVTELLREELDLSTVNCQPSTVYACGPPQMLEAVRALCAERDVPAQLALESGMACGFGACFGCVVPTKNGYVRLCVDGPVLDAADLQVVEAH